MQLWTWSATKVLLAVLLLITNRYTDTHNRPCLQYKFPLHPCQNPVWMSCGWSPDYIPLWFRPSAKQINKCISFTVIRVLLRSAQGTHHRPAKQQTVTWISLFTAVVFPLCWRYAIIHEEAFPMVITFFELFWRPSERGNGVTRYTSYCCVIAVEKLTSSTHSLGHVARKEG